MSTLWASRSKGPHSWRVQGAGLQSLSLIGDQALRLILKAIAKGDHGGYYKIADIGRAELIEDMAVGAKRIQPWLLPDSCLERVDIDPADRSRPRPDIMLVEMSQH